MSHIIIILFTLLYQGNIQEIHFGNGGGFSGLSYDYVLDLEGTIYQRNAFTEVRTAIHTVDRILVDSLFESVITDRLIDFQQNDPGNTYKYIDLKGTHGSHKITWSGKSKNNKLNLLYQKLKLLQQIKE